MFISFFLFVLSFALSTLVIMERRNISGTWYHAGVEEPCQRNLVARSRDKRPFTALLYYWHPLLGGRFAFPILYGLKRSDNSGVLVYRTGLSYGACWFGAMQLRPGIWLTLTSTDNDQQLDPTTSYRLWPWQQEGGWRGWFRRLTRRK